MVSKQLLGRTDSIRGFVMDFAEPGNTVHAMKRWVEIEFDCLPLRTIGRLDIPLDASPAYQAKCERIKAALEQHGSHNSYYLHNAQVSFYLTNSADCGMLQYSFEGTVLTNTQDQQTQDCYLKVQLKRETCDWLTQPIVEWFADSVRYAVAVEFDRYIQAGDLERTKERISEMEAAQDASQAFLGMYL
tara:strand:+ start:141 stop:704 length:564 start_codon:yes stop_codon:yes gene_type:complete